MKIVPIFLLSCFFAFIAAVVISIPAGVAEKPKTPQCLHTNLALVYRMPYITNNGVAKRVKITQYTCSNCLTNWYQTNQLASFSGPGF